MNSGIYKITHIESNKTYIGQSQDLERRLKSHVNWFINPKRIVNKHLYNYAKKYPLESFSFDIIEYCNIEKLDEKELYWFEVYKENTFNIRLDPVTNRGLKRTDEFCAMNSEIQKKRFLNPDNLAKHREMIKQRSLNPKWIKGINEAAIRRATNPEWRRKHKEMVNGDENKNKIKIKNFNTGYSHCVEMLDKEENVLDYFLSVEDASRSINKPRGNISSCLSGRIKTAYGYKWRYLTKEEYLNLNGGQILK
jgi:group I intron endonuclease